MRSQAVRCPQCKEPVSPFAAGCAICGADLERHRAERAARRSRAPSFALPSVRLPALENDWVAVAVLGCVVLLVPVLGLILCLVAAFDRSRANVRPALLALAGAAFLLLALPSVRYGVLQLLF